MYRKIMVPLDGSSFAEHALPLARAIARRCEAELHLVAVVPPLAEAYTEGVFFGTADLEAEVVSRQKGYLSRVRGQLAGDLNVSVVVMEGEVAGCLCTHATDCGADLVVMATHGRSPLARFWLGSVADEVVRHATLPILLVRPDEGPVNLAAEPLPLRVLVPLDGTELAERILGPAAALSDVVPGLELLLLRVIHPTVPVAGMPEGPGADLEAHHLLKEVQVLQEELHRDAESYLHGVARPLEARGLKVTISIAVDHRPEEAILHEAEKSGASLIALETHGRGGLSRLMLGSVADKVVRGAHMPVLVQRPVSV